MQCFFRSLTVSDVDVVSQDAYGLSRYVDLVAMHTGAKTVLLLNSAGLKLIEAFKLRKPRRNIAIQEQCLLAIGSLESRLTLQNSANLCVYLSSESS